MGKNIEWNELTEEQISFINNFLKNPPTYYKWFYSFYKKYIGTTIFFTIIIVGILAIIQNNTNLDLWNIMLSLFFFNICFFLTNSIVYAMSIYFSLFIFLK